MPSPLPAPAPPTCSRARNPPPVIVEFDFATPLYAQAIRLRHEVLRVPLGRTIADDDIAAEWAQRHFGALLGGRLLGVASLAPVDGGLKMRQVAVDDAVRGRGVGRDLVRACERAARLGGADALYCHARLTARAFYERCGWMVRGEQFTEVGLPHVRAYAPLNAE